MRVVVIGAGVGGLTTAAILARAGLDVTVLEAHIYPGGSAGTFYHKGYRFDAGATLAGGFYPGGPMDLLANIVGIEQWPLEIPDVAMRVHLPDGAQVDRTGRETRWEIQREAFGVQSLDFWRWQERTADALWDLALRNPPWPPTSPAEAFDLGQKALAWLAHKPIRHLNPFLALDALLPVAYRLQGLPEHLRLFLDAQLLIASQATTADTYALYAASALDLPRRGVAHLAGGMGTVSRMLAEAVTRSGGSIHYRQEATHMKVEGGRPVAVETKRGGSFPADAAVFNLTPWNIAQLLGEMAPARLKRLRARPDVGGGAFTVYVGANDLILPDDLPLHHQVIRRRPLGEGNTVFLSISPAWDAARAPVGRRAVTISTHTRLDPWWELHQNDPDAYEARKADYVTRLLDAAEVAVPGLKGAAELIMPGTPVTFARFTRRAWGWVGGFPQTSLFTARKPHLGKGLWMVGESIFPGQSVPAVALGGMRIAASILNELAIPLPAFSTALPPISHRAAHPVKGNQAISV